MQDIVKSLNPSNKVEPSRSRFTQLILEHGEKSLQDWAVAAYSSPEEPSPSSPSSPLRQKGIQWEQATKKTSTPIRSAKKVSSPQEKHSDTNAYPTANMTKVEGRLHLCSKSIVFEPADPSRSIVRCPFQRMAEAPKEYPSDQSFAAMCIECHVMKHILILQSHRPFETVETPVRFRFTFLHSTPTMFISLCEELFRLAQKPSHSAGQVVELNKLLQPMLDRPFDLGNLVDIQEKPLTPNIRCQILRPLQAQPGVLIVTAERVYFQPASGVLNNVSETVTTHWLQREILVTARRYKGLRDSALEIYWSDQTSTLFAFDRRHDREQILRVINSEATCVTDRDFVIKAAEEWRKGTIDNYEYLLAINSAAGRSFHDLSRYPVFPWVIADFQSDKLDLNNSSTFRDLTKPVGALNSKRLEYFQQRLAGMGDMEDSFLYGTHYSAPGYVLYYLVRSMPEQMLCLQNGKFDAPDRMFFSVLNCFNCAMTNHADVKELIPEFYSTDDNCDFLINARGLQLGATQNGDRVNDVHLPPWARSGRDFIRKNRKALESDHCTKHLPKWLDLIFGFRSRGDEALEAMNLFHSNAYLGPNDLADMGSEEERTQAELHATEFGIVPDQLFNGNHPEKSEDTPIDSFICPDIGRASSKDDSSQREAWELLDSPTENQEVGLSGSNITIESGKEQPSVSQLSRRPSLEDRLQDSGVNVELPMSGDGELAGGDIGRVSSFSVSDAKPESGNDDHPKSAQSPSTKTPIPVSPASSTWDMKIIHRKKVHNEAVSGCCIVFEEQDTSNPPMLVTSSLDGGLMAHKISLELESPTNSDVGSLAATFTRFSYNTIMNRTGNNPQNTKPKIVEHRSHSSRDPLASLVLALDGSGGQVAFAGGHDDVILAYGVNSSCAVASVYSHRDAVTGLDLIARNPLQADSTLWREGSTHILVSGSWDATVKVWSVVVAAGETVSISREPVAELFDADSAIVSVSAQMLPTGGGLIAAGCADGSFSVWNVHSDGVQVLVHTENAKKGSGPCSVVQWVMESGSSHLFAGFSTGKIASYSIIDGKLQRQAAVSIGVAILSLVYSEGVILVGCADGGLRLIPVRNATKFEDKPTLWNTVNGKAAPAITSIGLSRVPNGDDAGRRICVTGGEDGTVALFELRNQVN